MKLVVTGASGFIGRALLLRLSRLNNFNVIGCVRCENKCTVATAPLVSVGDLSFQTDWSKVLEGSHVVVHAAARVHVMHDIASDPLDAFRQINLHGTLNLARQAVAAGVRRFVFISSIGVNGAATYSHPFTPQDAAAPHSPYAVSKYEAELGLQELAAKTSMEVVIVRPPLVYGPSAPGNFGSLIQWMRRGVPVPLGAVVHNSRSLIGLDNLVDLLQVCATHPAAANQTFLASDGEDVSTADLLRRIGAALGKPARLLPVPVGVLKLGAVALGKADMAQRLLGSLQIDISKNRQLLGWQPPLSLDEGLKRVVADF